MLVAYFLENALWITVTVQILMALFHLTARCTLWFDDRAYTEVIRFAATGWGNAVGSLRSCD
jgi:hypothetical protein